MSRAAATSALAAPFLQTAILSAEEPLNGTAGVDRVVILPGKTYLRGWVAYGEPPIWCWTATPACNFGRLDQRTISVTQTSEVFDLKPTSESFLDSVES